MGKIIVLAEKPSVGRELARVLGCTKKANGFIDGPKYTVTWSLGHLVTLADPAKYNKDYEHWRMEDLPMLPDKMKLEVIRETSKQFKVVKDLLKAPSTDQLVIATDAGREGELVARWIIEKAGYRKPIKRLWISSQTDKAIKEGFAHLKDGKEYENLYKSGQCRAEADWLVGLNVTRALTCKHNARLAAGRVQTPTLSMVVDRENEIKRFVPKDYYTVEATTRDFSLKWRDRKTGELRIFQKEKAEQIVKKAKDAVAIVTDVKTERKKEAPPQLYDLTELQRDANKRYQYSAKKTLSIMQNLYEKHKIVTYPRTDSKYLSDDIVSSFGERLKAISVGPYAKAARSVKLTEYKMDKRYVDNAKVSDHHAIIPTEQDVNLYALDQEEKNIFDLIAKRFLAMFAKAYEYERTTVVCDVEGEEFYARGRVVLEEGWKNILSLQPDEETEETDQTMPRIEKGGKHKIISVKYTAGKTKPPARYSEATLLYAMEHAGKFVDKGELKEVLKDVSGLGTPATRADIIEKLVDSGCIERQKNELVPTSKAMQLVEIVPPDLKSPELTAKWETDLAKISKGQYSSQAFIKEMKQYAEALVKSVSTSAMTYRHDNLTKEVCPECGEYLLEINGKKGKMYVCSNRECGYRRNVSFLTNVRCPNCHKVLTLYGEGEDKIYRCSCGFRQKQSKMKFGEKTNNRDVQNYLKKQKAEEKEFKNNALAEALEKALYKK